MRRQRIFGSIALVVAAIVGWLFFFEGLASSVESGTALVEVKDEEVQLLVLVIAGGTKPPYPILRTYWYGRNVFLHLFSTLSSFALVRREIAHRVRPSGVVIYMVNFDPTIKKPK
jgi:hypothetical protein